MRAGLLNKKIEIYSCTTATNDFGHIDNTYTKTYVTRANVKYDSGNRQFENNEVFFTNDVTFTVRSYVPVELTARIKYDDKFYRILGIEKSDPLNNQTITTELINE